MIKIFAKYLFWTLSENPKYVPKLWPNLKNMQTNFWKSKIKCYHSNTHTMYYISSTYFFHQIFVPFVIWTNVSKCVLNFLPLQIWTFWPKEPKNLNFIFSFQAHYPQPKQNPKSPKDPNLIIIFTMKQVYTYFWWILPVADLFKFPCLGHSTRRLPPKSFLHGHSAMATKIISRTF